jgi:hypothetical protein
MWDANDYHLHLTVDDAPRLSWGPDTVSLDESSVIAISCHWEKCHVIRPSYEVPILLHGFDQIWGFSTNIHRGLQYHILRKSVEWEPRRYMRAVGQTERRTDERTVEQDEANRRFLATMPKRLNSKSHISVSCFRCQLYESKIISTSWESWIFLFFYTIPFNYLSYVHISGLLQFSLLALLGALIRTDWKWMPQHPSKSGWVCTSMKDVTLEATVMLNNQN